MYKIDRRGGGVQKSYTRKLGNFLENDFWTRPRPPPPINFVHDHFFKIL